MDARVLSIKTKESKSMLVELTVEINREKKKYIINEGTYRKIGCPLSDDLIDEDALEHIRGEDERRRALKKALNVLSFSDNSESKLREKLYRAGFSSSAANFAIEQCCSLGYIDELRQIERLVMREYSYLFGPKKILYKLSHRGYSTKKILSVISSLKENGKIDFDKTKQELLNTKLESDASYEEKMKLLQKYGYVK